MKSLWHTLYLAIVVTASGCATKVASQSEAPPKNSIALPAFGAIASVNLSDGVDVTEANIMADKFMRFYLSNCGMPYGIEKHGGYWTARLGTGYVGLHFPGTLWISSATGDVVLQPSPKGLSDSEKRQIEAAIPIAQKLNSQ